MLALPTSSPAVPANPEPSTVVQPDGARIVIRLKGDERFHWHEDAAGFPIIREGTGGPWVYATEGGGGLVATHHVVGKDDPVTVGLARPDIAQLRAAAPARLQALAGDGPRQAAATVGTLKNLVVLVNFTDLTIPQTNQEFDDLFNQVGYSADGAAGSVKDYYLEVSRGALTVQSVIAGPVTVSQGYAYYGGNDASGNDLRPRTMVQEALSLLAAGGFDFQTVDGDGDGWVDGLTILHAGGGEEYSGNDPDYIWSHAWALSTVVTYSGVKMQRYHTEPTRRGWDSSAGTQGITRIGVICHETGHFLGLPDLYDTTYASKGIGNFCLMAGGSWNGNSGTSPAHMSAWCKARLQWVTPTVLSTGGGPYVAAAVEAGGLVHRLGGLMPAGQYYLLENRQGIGFDSALPGTKRGILIWHINENKSGNSDSSKVNGEVQYLVDLEEASGVQHLELNQNSGDDNDYFRLGTLTDFTNATSPANISGLNVTGISDTGTTMTFHISATASIPTVTTTAPLVQGTTAVGGGNVTSDGMATIIARGVCWSNSANPTVADSHTTDAGTTGPFTSQLTGLALGTLYHVRAYATNSAGTGYGEDLTFLAASTFLREPFESSFVGGAPPGWTKAFLSSSVDWTRNSGDHRTQGAYAGSYNALLYANSPDNHQTYLISPAMNLAGATGITLRFWHKQAVWSGDQDTLAVSYKTAPDGPWQQLAIYATNLSSWTGETISLPNPSATYYIGFLGNARYGYGVCIDDVTVTGIPAPALATVTTTAISGITRTAAVCGGTVTDDGNATVTARGVCWSISANPTVSDGHTSDGSGTGPFASDLTGLSPRTLYHVRAYATNAAGTAYGDDQTFTTLALGDVTGDGHVDAADLAAISGCWSTTTGQPGFQAACDLNDDGKIDVADLLALGRDWGI